MKNNQPVCHCYLELAGRQLGKNMTTKQQKQTEYERQGQIRTTELGSSEVYPQFQQTEKEHLRFSRLSSYIEKANNDR